MANRWLKIVLVSLLFVSGLFGATTAQAEETTTVSAYTAGTKPVGQTTYVWGTASGAPNRPVSVQALVNGSWSTSQKGTTSSTGSYSLPLTYGINTPGTYSYRALVQTSTGAYVASPTVTLTRTQSVTVTAATAGTKPVGQSTNIWGTATGAAYRPVSVQALVNGSWSTSQKGTTSASGSYALPLTYGINTPGTYSFRALVLTPQGAWVSSPAVTLTRTQSVTVTAATAGSKPVGQSTSVWGTAKGAPYRPISVQVSYNGGWATTASGTTSSTGSYALPLTYGMNTPGTYSFRAVVTTSTGARVASPVVTLTRTAPIVLNQAAVEQAKSYMSWTHFSRQGLIDQLVYEGYSTTDSTRAVDSLGINWYSEAVEHAKSYLDALSFSEVELLDQLLYDEYTAAQASYGVANSGGDWYAEAAEAAAEYLEYDPTFTRADLIDQLIYEGFTYAQAFHGVDSVGLY